MRLTSRHLTKDQKKYVKDAFTFFCQMLSIDYKKNHFWVSVRKGLPELYGFIIPIDKNRYKIELDVEQDPDDIISTLAHELVHAKQYIDGRLTYDSNGMLVWKGKLVSNDDWTTEQYNSCEFEKEALTKEKYLLELYIDINPIENFENDFQ